MAEAAQLRRQVESLHREISELRENEELFRRGLEPGGSVKPFSARGLALKVRDVLDANRSVD